MIITKKSLREKYKHEITYYLENKKNDPFFHIFSVSNKLCDFYVAGYNSDYIFKIQFPNEKINLKSYKKYVTEKFPHTPLITRKFFIIYPSPINRTAQFVEICQ
jgi:hypothetical protein